MIVSLHLCEKSLTFAQTLDEETKPLRVLDAAKLNPNGLQTFAMSNTGTGDFAAGAVAMLELLEATVGRPLAVCSELDPKQIASIEDPGGVLAISPELMARSETSHSENSASSESTS